MHTQTPEIDLEDARSVNAPIAAAIEASMLLHGVSVAQAAKTIGRSRQTFFRRLERPSTFKLNELGALGESLEGDMLFFFRVRR